MGKGNNQHRKALEKIASNPTKFGFRDVVFLSIESNFYNGKRLIAQPDIIIETSKREVHIIEYKGNGNEEYLKRARKQLETAVWWIGKYRPDILPENIHTHIISGTDPRYRDLLR